MCVALLFVLSGCGSDRDGSSLVRDSNGVASVSGEAVVGETLAASVADDDGVQADTDSYQWYADGELIEGATASTYTLTANEGSAAVTVVVRYGDNAGNRETVTSAPVDIQAAFTLGAMFIQGLVDGAACDIFAIDASGSASSPSLSSGTTVNGVVVFEGLVPVDGAALISCSGGTYLSEATGVLLDAPTTRAVVDVQGDTVFTVSPLTEMAVALAQTAGDLNTALSVHNITVARTFAVSGDITEIMPTDLMVMAAAEDDEGRYATALVIIAQYDANSTDTSTAEDVAALAADLQDGSFSQATLDDLNQATADLDTTVVASNLNPAVTAQVQNAINNTPEPAMFDGLSATVPNDQVDPLAGMITVTDVNFGEDQVTPQSGTVTTYGTFSVVAEGNWTYSLDTQNETVAGLEIGESVNDVIAITSVDGTPANLVVRIARLTQVAEITNDIFGDTGELRYNLEEDLRQGRLKFSFLKTDALGSDGNQKDAYITLYGSSGSSSESLVDLRIQGSETLDDGSVREPRFLIRNTDSSAYPGDIIEAPFSPNEFYEIEIIWDVGQSNQVEVLINGVSIAGGPFLTGAVADSDFTDFDQWFSSGVQRAQWRFGDNGTTIPFGFYYVDDIEIYSDTAGTILAYEDDFETRTVGEDLSDSTQYPDSIDAEVDVYDVSEGGENIPAVFFNLVAATTSDSTETLMDNILVLDPDPGEAMLVAQVGTTTEYGSFSIAASGDWEYDLDTANETVAALVQGDRITDTIAVSSVDGSSDELVITINGVGGGPTGDNNIAVIVDTLGTDTGELRYELGGDGPLLAGRLELQFKRLDDDLGSADAFITLFNENTNNDGAILDFRVRDDSYGVRSPSDVDTSSLPLVLDAFMDVVVTWNYTAGPTMQPEVTVTVDGVSLAPFTPTNNSFGGVTHVAVRFGGNSAQTPDTARVSVDDLAIYSDVAGTTEVFADDFESYLNGDSLDVDNGASPYAENTSEATVETIEGAGGPGTPGNQIAEIVDTLDSDTGELRYELAGDGPLAAGRLEVAIKRLDDDLGNADAFITLFNEDTNNAGAILDFRIRDDSYGVRDPSSTDTSSLPFMLDTWMNVVITWEYPGGDVMMLPEVVISVDGVSLDPFVPGNAAFGGVTHIAFRLGGNSATSGATGIFSIDNLAIYSDTAGMAEVFSDDFESYLEDDSLDTDNGASPYNDSTSEATVAVEDGDAGGPGTPGNQIAEIVDTIDTDTGELRYELGADGPLAAGRLEASIKRLDDDLGNADAFITLFNENTNNAGAILDFRIRDDSYGVRDPSSTDTSSLPFMLDTFMDLVIVWEYPGDVAITKPMVTITIDGVSLAPFEPGNDAFGGVTHIAFRLGGNGAISGPTGVFSVDEIAIYSDTAGTVEVFSDDFETYIEDDSLDIDNGASPYSENTSEATVGVEE